MYKDNNLTNVQDLISHLHTFVHDIINVFRWGIDRNITAEGGATALSQIKKLKEEVQEIEDALLAGNKEELMDGIGDTFVVLIQVCRLSGVDLGESLGQAWHEIKDRKGTMIDGVFVKESDLKGTDIEI